MISGISRKSVIIDIDGPNVRFAVATPGKPTGDMIFERLTLPPHIQSDSALDVGAFIGEQLAAQKISVSRAVMLAPRGRAVLMDMQLPGEIDDEELPDMVRYQAEKELPFAADNAVIDFRRSRQATSGDEESTAVTVFAVQAATLDYYRGVAEAAGFKRIALTLRPSAMAAYVKRAVDCEAGECIALVFVADNEVEIDFIVDGEPVFSRSAALPDGKSAQRGERVVRELKLSMQGFSAARGDLEVNGVLLAGDPQISSVACADLEGQLDCECMIFRTSVPREAERLDQSWAAVLGAAMATAGPEGELPDLLNPRQSVDRQALRRRQSSLAMITVMMALILACWGGFAHVSSLNAEAQRMGILRNQTEDKAKVVEKLRKRLRIIDDWPDGQVDWLAHMSFISQLAPGAEALYVPEIKTDKNGKLTLPVRAVNAETIQSFAAALAAVDGYSVTLASLSPQGLDKLNLGYVFANILEIKIDADMEVKLGKTLPGRPVDDDSENELPRRFGRDGGRRRGR